MDTILGKPLLPRINRKQQKTIRVSQNSSTSFCVQKALNTPHAYEKSLFKDCGPCIN